MSIKVEHVNYSEEEEESIDSDEDDEFEDEEESYPENGNSDNESFKTAEEERIKQVLVRSNSSTPSSLSFSTSKTVVKKGYKGALLHL